MGIVAEFSDSKEVGWDITQNVNQMLDLWGIYLELLNYPEVILVRSGTTTLLYDKKSVKVKVVEPKSNGSAT